MTTLTIALPDGIFEAVRKAPDEVAQEMRIAVAVRWYAQGLISQGKGAEIAALTRSQFIDALGLAGVPACQETISEIREVLSRG
jgi:predicted HTH domain antitoxin